jgi:hypothetical protein
MVVTDTTRLIDATRTLRLENQEAFRAEGVCAKA